MFTRSSRVALRASAARPGVTRRLPVQANRLKSSDAAMSPLEKAVTPDYSTHQFHLYHASHFALATTTMPLFAYALYFAPGSLVSKCVDLTILAFVPYHAHVGMNMVLTDYANFKGARFGMAALTGLATLGMLKMVVAGDGIYDSVRPLFFGRPTHER